jgi:arylsulfate sulfotransferase
LQTTTCKLFLMVFVMTLGSSCKWGTPVIENIEFDRNPSEAVPLAANVVLETDRPTTVVLEFEEGGRAWRVETGLPFRTVHSVPILGMRPDRTHAIRVVVTDENGRTATSEVFEVRTDSLPDIFPRLDVRVNQSDRMEFGVTMFSLAYRPNGNAQRDYGALVAVDEVGEVVWYYLADHRIGDARRLENGNLLYVSDAQRNIHEIDMLGRRIHSWHANSTSPGDIANGSIGVDTETFHHESFPTPAGNIMTLSREVRTYEDYPTSDSDPGAPKGLADLTGDVVVEFARNGETIREIHLLDILDPYRISYDSIGNVAVAPGTNPRHDWAHANAVISDASGRYAIVSLRHQDALVKIDMETGELVWILGDHTGWDSEWQDYLLVPQGEILWPYHPHAPMITPQGTVLVFDNGNHRAQPFDEPMLVSESFSRAVEYRVDEDNMVVREVWSYGGEGDEKYFASFVGDADWMPQTGNVLATFGGLIFDSEGIPTDRGGGGHYRSRIVEVAGDRPVEKVFELIIDEEAPEGWQVYRAERLPGLYP